MVNKRESTNVKLVAIINSKNNDQEEERAVLQDEKKAKARLQRASLYGGWLGSVGSNHRLSLNVGGARTKIPKIKKLSKLSSSPFVTNEVIAEHLKPPKQFETSVPPGAHAEQFRVVANATAVSFNDPDRVCYNSSSMIDGLHNLPQPPWYCGYSNRIVPAETDMITAAARYGFRGSKNMQQFNTAPYAPPSRTKTSHTPKFLDCGDYINEYVPPILASRVQTVNGFESPKLWPENTEFVNGYKKKQLPTSWAYKRETTVDLPTRPIVSEDLAGVMKTIDSQSELLQDYCRQESAKSFLSLPMASQRKFDDTWQSSVAKNANNSLKHSLHRTKPVYEAHTLMDESDEIRYSGTTALIVHSQTSDELKFRIRMERSKSKVKTPFQAKWNNVIQNFKMLAVKLKRSQSMKTVLNEFSICIEEAAVANGSATSINRLNFLQACAKLSFFEGTPQKQLSLLYSQFDPMKKNNARFVEMMAAFSVLDKPDESPYDKLATLWNIVEIYGKDRNVLDSCLEILTTCASSLADVTRIQELFVQEFRAVCYDMAMTYNPSRTSTAGTSYSSTMTLELPSSPPRTAETARTTTAGTVGTSPKNGTSAAGSTPAAPVTTTALTTAMKKSLSFQPQYNICEHFLNCSTFVQVLRKCPLLVEAFDSQLSCVLVQCHGKDDRYKEPEIEPEPENYDFTWILKKNKAAAAAAASAAAETRARAASRDKGSSFEIL